jgi:hypothetical protein
MIDFLTQYAPPIIQTGAILAPILPTVIVKAVNDKKAITTFETMKAQSNTKLDEVRVLVQSLREKEQAMVQEISKIKNTTDTFKGQIDRIESSVDQKMTEVSRSVLAFKEDDLYQKMLTGLEEMKEMKQTMILKDDLIERQAQVIKEIHKKLGELK